MKTLLVLFICVLSIYAKAQVTNLPKLETENGVTKTVMNPKLYPLLLKVHVSENNTTDFKNFITHLKYFEVFSSDNLTSGDILSAKMNSFIKSQLFTEVNPNTYELVADNQKEYIILKQDPNKVTVAYTFTTKLEYDGIKELNLM